MQDFPEKHRSSKRPSGTKKHRSSAEKHRAPKQGAFGDQLGYELLSLLGALQVGPSWRPSNIPRLPPGGCVFTVCLGLATADADQGSTSVSRSTTSQPNSIVASCQSARQHQLHWCSTPLLHGTNLSIGNSSSTSGAKWGRNFRSPDTTPAATSRPNASATCSGRFSERTYASAPPIMSVTSCAGRVWSKSSRNEDQREAALVDNLGD